MVGHAVGYAAGGHAYRIYNLSSRKVVVRRDAIVEERPVGIKRHTTPPLTPLNGDPDAPVEAGEQSDPSTGASDDTPSPIKCNPTQRQSTKHLKLPRIQHVASLICRHLGAGGIPNGRAAPSASLTTSQAGQARRSRRPPPVRPSALYRPP